MPETEFLDLTAEDVDEATWDQLVQGVLEEHEEDAESDPFTNSGCGCITECVFCESVG